MFFLQVRSIWNGSNPWCYLCFASKYCQWKSLCFSVVLVGYFVGFNRSFGDLSHGVYGKLIWNKTEVLFSPWNWQSLCNIGKFLQLFANRRFLNFLWRIFKNFQFSKISAIIRVFAYYGNFWKFAIFNIFERIMQFK